MLSPFVQFNRQLSELERLFAVSARAAVRPTPEPRFSVTKTDEAWLVQGTLPGWSPEQVVLEVRDGVLTLSGSDRKAVPEGFVPVHRERPERSFTRTLRLPRDVSATDISATSEHGILTVTLPRTPRPEPRRIPVRAA